MRKEFYTGHLFDVYRYFGAHKEGENFIFRVFAPSAKGVCVFGEFSNWTEIPMYQEGQSGVYVSEPIPAKTGQLYKYCIYTANGGRVEHCDPYGFQMELRPGDCSILTDLYSYKFKDEKWMKNRTVGFDSPVNIYEIHAGSWRKKGEGQTDWYTYTELAKLLIPYVKKNHYTHIEMMPLSEHPFDGSWGYQNTGFFAPTARYGTPDELKKFVDECHQAGIGVIMDFVPVHFAVDYYGLKEFDGTCLYEYPNAAVGESEWGSCNFMHSRGEVRCFLQSAANYWLSEFHFDGIRMDAVSRLIYWQGDEARGVNGTTLDFLKVMNQGLKSLHPTAMLIAEDSTNFPGVTKPVDQGGVGFDYKWDLGFMHDTLEYFQSAPEYRSRDYHKLTFSMMYYYNERFLLEYCHDEVVHGKATILQKMNGEYEDKFPQARAMYLYMMAHPGKKLNFMGNEFGQLREWDESREQKWASRETGCSPNFWSRSIGWYGAAIVDVLDYLPQETEGRDSVLQILQDLAQTMVKYQDPQSGTWYQVTDQGARKGNYLESSATALFIYTLAKAINEGYIGNEYITPVQKAFNGMIREFTRLEEDGTYTLTHCCAVAGLGGNSGKYRDGSFEYYIGEPVIENDPKSVGAFILAAIEYERMN